MHPGDVATPDNEMHVDDTLEIDGSLMLVDGQNNQVGQFRAGCGFPAQPPHNPNLPLPDAVAEGNLNDSTLE